MKKILDQDQSLAVKKINKDLIILASAGTGKTELLVQRYLEILEKEHLNCSEILAITFTEKAASEMQERIHKAIQEKIHSASSEISKNYWVSIYQNFESNQISTIHVFCTRLIRKNAYILKIQSDFKIVEDYYFENEFRSYTQDILYHWAILSDQSLSKKKKNLKKIILDYKKLLEKYSYQEIIYFLEIFFKNPFLLKKEWKNLKKITNKQFELFIQKNLKRTLTYKINMLFSRGEESLFLNLKRSLLESKDSLRKGKKKIAVFLDQMLSFLEILEKYNSQEISFQELEDDYKIIQKDFSQSQGFKNYYEESWLGKDEFPFLKYFEEFQWIFPRSFFELLFERNFSYLENQLSDFQTLLEIYDTLIQMIPSYKMASEFLRDWYYGKILGFKDLEMRAYDLLDQMKSSILKPYKYLMLDEFQDINNIQKKFIEFFLKKKKYTPTYICLLGDLKQSIYQFRGSDIKMLQKFFFTLKKRYPETYKKITLKKNYRSLSFLIHFNNYFFENLMKNPFELFETPYQKIYPNRSEMDYPVEFLLGFEDTEEDQEKSFSFFFLPQEKKIVEEAQDIASRILSLKKEDKEFKYEDTAILFLRPRNVLHIYIKVFELHQIPYQNIKEENFEDIQEIKDAICLIEFLHNQNNELALCGLLRSPFCFVSDRTLYELVHYDPENRKKPLEERSLLRAFFRFSKESFFLRKDIEKMKLLEFKAWLKKIKKKQDQMNPSDFLAYAFENSLYFESFATQSQREKVYGHFRFFLAEIKKNEILNQNFESFLFYIDKFQSKLKLVESLEENIGVKLLSIHKSKGMEFSYVFIAQSIFNLMIPEKKIFFHNNIFPFFFISKDFNSEIDKCLPFIFFKDQNKREIIAELKRTLYVAFTRAKNRLFISAYLTKSQSNLKTIRSSYSLKNINFLTYLEHIFDLEQNIKKLVLSLKDFDKIEIQEKEIKIILYKNYRFFYSKELSKE